MRHARLRITITAAVIVPLAPLPAQRAPAAVERVGQWGCLECTTGHQFAAIVAIAVSREGELYVIDRDEPRVRIFGPDGTLVRAFGRRGQGPGELEAPVGIALGADGAMAIPDVRTSRITYFASDGTVRGSAPLAGIPTAVAKHPARDEVLLAFTDFRSGATLERWAREAREGTRVAQLPDLPASHGLPGAIHSMAVSPDGVVAIGDGTEEYRIRRLGPDGRSAGPDIVRDIPRAERTAEEIAELEVRRASRGAQMQRALERERGGARSSGGAGMPAVRALRNHFDAGALRYDGAGRLWVRTQRAAPGRTIFDVFDASGRLIGEVELPALVRSYDIAGEYLAAAIAGDEDVPMISLWRVRWR